MLTEEVSLMGLWEDFPLLSTWVTHTHTHTPGCRSAWVAERETTGYEPFALHAPIQWAIQGHAIKNRGAFNKPAAVGD